MWLIKIILMIGLVNYMTQNTKQLKADIGIEIYIPYPRPLGEGEMVA